ncbi:hypothetical protein LCGC14_2984930 [marine sediment metagenome]|uniref:Uncharacterized protein n=1 Tax=marine sediment metagenome TaxID=412755 RepID=A0A0F8XT40_9ZZZZ
MNAVLYLNNVYYHTIETPKHMPIIHWVIPISTPTRVHRQYDRILRDDFNSIEFRHCGLGNYHCHLSKEEEEIVRKAEYPKGI